MRLVIQRVKKASVSINNNIYSSIDIGYLIYVGFGNLDDIQKVDKVVSKILKLRIFEDSNKKMNLDINQVSGSILVVSQFTLYASLNSGNRPSFIDSMKPDCAIKLYDYFVEKLKENNIVVKTGIFQEDMEISSINMGPATIIYEV